MRIGLAAVYDAQIFRQADAVLVVLRIACLLACFLSFHCAAPFAGFAFSLYPIKKNYLLKLRKKSRTTDKGRPIKSTVLLPALAFRAHALLAVIGFFVYLLKFAHQRVTRVGRCALVFKRAFRENIELA